ncbi:OFA family MFS transporter [Ferrovibrio sp.]|uniref:OFA family MFS transporter n=1 Tax=Ferrovibrio sp. TaxID=1917215 RepID=UPI0025B8FFCB|nr:OFA family MFS transporter [Ferrovibrio sp.]
MAIHLCIGMAYGFSVFWLPLSRQIGGAAAKACPPEMTWVGALFTTSCDWKVSELGWMYTLFFVILGSAAAIWGGWLERAGPRKAGFVAALCWCGGLFIGAIGVYTHQLWLMWLGSGVIGGVGLGLGYISPVSTLIKWFPDRRGMATGMAIMGFGGGAMIGAPLANILMGIFRTDASNGVWQTFVVMGVIYLVFMMGGAFGYRIPPAGWRPDGWTPPPENAKSMITKHHVHLKNAHKTPQFWLVWAVLTLNVSAGIGVIGMASPMLQEIFAGGLIGHPDISFTQLDPDQRRMVAAIAAGFTGLLSLFNIGGRFFWASLSDKLGRKMTYYTFFALGIALYAAAPWAGHIGSKAMFVLFFGIILSMYGGGFSTVPAYLADLFGTQFVGAIHGRLLTAWSTAGIIGPVVVNYIREAQIAAGVPRAQVYDFTMYILAGMLLVGFICNLLVKPVDPKWYMSEQEVADMQAKVAVTATGPTGSFGIGRGGFDGRAALAWAIVGIPILWGVWTTLSNTFVLFR